MVKLILISLLLPLFLSCGGADTRKLEVRSWAYQLQSADPEEISKSGFDLLVIDYSRDGSEEGRYSRDEIEIVKESGKTVLAYLSIGEAESYRFYWNKDWENSPPPWLGEENEEWKGNYAVKFWYPEWEEIVFNYIDRILEEGFQGLYLDKVDEFEYWSEQGYDESEIARKMADFIKKISDYCRSKLKSCYIVPQNGERLLLFEKKSLLKTVSGWAVEDLFYDGTAPKPQEEIEERTELLNAVRDSGKPVLSVDYVDDGSGYYGENLERIRDYLKKAKAFDYIPYVARSDRELDELLTISLEIKD